MLKLCKSLSWISDEQLKRLIFKIFKLIWKTEVQRLWSVLLSKRTKREEQ